MTRLLLVLLLAAAAACEPRVRPAATGGESDGPRLRGALLGQPVAKPAATLTDTDGRPFDLRAGTAGYLTLVFFGYTHCPDICPVHMANLGAVIRDMAPSAQRRIKVLFVTTDPARDTPTRLRGWLDNFSRDFIGLTGDPDTVAALQLAMGFRPAVAGAPDSAGGYLVGHAAAVIAFTPDDTARVVYPFGIRQADWAHDLPRLLQNPWAGS